MSDWNEAIRKLNAEAAAKEQQSKPMTTPDAICEDISFLRHTANCELFHPERAKQLNRIADLIQQQLAKIERLSAALEPFDEAFGEDVDDDFGDDTPVVVTIEGRSRLYALTLGDFRRIRAALKASGEG